MTWFESMSNNKSSIAGHSETKRNLHEIKKKNIREREKGVAGNNEFKDGLSLLLGDDESCQQERHQSS